MQKPKNPISLVMVWMVRDIDYRIVIIKKS